jgi:hypothetical protein
VGVDTVVAVMRGTTRAETADVAMTVRKRGDRWTSDGNLTFPRLSKEGFTVTPVIEVYVQSAR